eukprot:3562699-Rhodomonas_salina.2
MQRRRKGRAERPVVGEEGFERRVAEVSEDHVDLQTPAVSEPALDELQPHVLAVLLEVLCTDQQHPVRHRHVINVTSARYRHVVVTCASV